MAHRKSSKKAPDVLSAAYLEHTSSKSELLKRLINVTETLSTLSDDIDPSTHPGLLSLSTTLVSSSIIGHRDKDVRLNAVLACCELFYIYAPEPPWSESEILEIFNQLVRQLGNLNSCEPSSKLFESYFRILEQLSEVKIGVVLVDLIRTERGTTSSKRGGKRGSLGREDNPALDTLCDLIRTLLNCVNLDQPPEVAAHAELAVAACIEEFEGNIPIQVLEELLTCVGQGPVIWVTNPAFAGNTKKRKSGGGGSSGKKGQDGELPPAQIQQTNPSYLVAAKVLRRTEDKISSPIAALLNGLLTGDPRVMGQTSLSTIDAEALALFAAPKKKGKGKKKKGADEDESSPTLAAHLAPKESQPGANVYSISYELHRIAPQILTTVIGTVSSSLENEDLAKRWQATKLLGRLFGARNSSIAEQFAPCFRSWLQRSKDPESKIRETMVKCLVNFLTTQYVQTELCADVNESLANLIIRDPLVDTRLLAIHQVCDLAHTAIVSNGTAASGEVAAAPGSSSSSKRSHPISVISPELLLAVASRISSKDKVEHKDAITGLAQIYHKHYIRPKLQYVQEGGDDVSIDEILEVWKGLKSAKGKNANSIDQIDEEKFAWIPGKVFECVFWSDDKEPDMRSRIFQIVDDVLLGTTKKDSGSTLSPTSRAVGLAIIIDSIKDKNNAYQWMTALFSQRRSLQMALGAYLDARSKAKECESGSAEAFTADSEAMEKLEQVAKLSAPLPENKSPSAAGSSSDLESILKKVHSAKDKHIFRILSTISLPTHSPSARLRAFDELPKRTKGMGNAAQSWVKTLARRCAMGAFLNAENIEHCIILSQECFENENCEVASILLECVKMATTIYPSLASTKEGFEHLVEFFDASRTTSSMSPNMKRGMEKYGVVTTLSEILARSKKGGGDDDMDFEDNTTLREQLLRLCTRDGTPEQARNSIFTIYSMINPQSTASSPGKSSLATRVRTEKEEFVPLLKALVNPSRLSIPDDTTNPKNRGRIVSILSAIAAIAECAPHAFNASGEGSKQGWGQRAVEFSLDTVLLGKNSMLNASDDDDSSDSDDDDDDEESPAKRGRSSKTAKRKSKGNEVSVHCQMLCGAIEVLVSHIRSTTLHVQRASALKGAPKLKPLSSDHIGEVFDTLTKIIEDGGVPPSSVNGRYCKTAKDQAELRRSASINLLRLCDANMLLQGEYLTPRMWHILSSSLLDKDKTVRSSMMDELCSMYNSTGKFRAQGVQQQALPLRFVALVSLCADGDNSATNAGAANVGNKKTTSVKSAATLLNKELRSTVQTFQAMARTKGRAAEKYFENMKKTLMPEYCVPYALHLLAFRHETASAAGTLAGEDETESEDESEDGAEKLRHSQEASQKMLKKRLKWLFDPLIHSLGTKADNISFLLRMVEMIGKHPPINVLKTSADVSALDMSLDDDDDDDADIYGNDVDEKEARARMNIIIQFSREVLLSHVKSDVNLTAFPGAIQLPPDLYGARRPRSSTSPMPLPRYDVDESAEKKKPRKSVSHFVDNAKKKLEQEEDEDEEDEDEEMDSPNQSERSDNTEEKSTSSPVSEEDKSPEKASSPGDKSEQSEDNKSPASSPEADEFDFGADLSPISKPSPAVVDKGKKKKSSSTGGGRRKSSTKSSKRKVDIFDETEFLKDSPDGGKPSAAKKRRKSSSAHTPKASSSRKSKSSKSSTTPVPVMINIDPNSAGSSDGKTKKKKATKPAAKKQQVSAKKKAKKSVSVEMKDDTFSFSGSPAPKAKKVSRAKTTSNGSTKKKAPAKKAPVKKASKAKISIGGKSKGKAAVKTQAKRASKGKAVSASPASTEASSPVRRSGRKRVAA